MGADSAAAAAMTMPSQNVTVLLPKTSATTSSTAARISGRSSILSANEEPLGRLTSMVEPSSERAIALLKSDPREGKREIISVTTVRHLRCNSPASTTACEACVPCDWDAC